MMEHIKKLMDESIIVDMHSDIPMHVSRRRKNGETKVIESNYLHDIKAGGVNVILCVLFIMDEELDNPFESAMEQLMLLKEDIEESKDNLMLCKTYEDVKTAVGEEKLALLVGFEGLEPIKTNKNLLKAFYELGVRFNGLNWSRTNLVSDGCGYDKIEHEKKLGLTEFGKLIVPYAENLGMITDLTHISEKGFWDALKLSKQPCIASHTNAQGVYQIVRNFTDEQLIALKNNNSVIGITGVSQFLKDITDKNFPTANDYLNHIDYINNLIGIDHIGIGLDLFKYFFNHDLYSMPAEFGEVPPDTIKNYQDIYKIVEGLISRAYSDDDIKKVLGGNFIRLLKELL